MKGLPRMTPEILHRQLRVAPLQVPLESLKEHPADAILRHAIRTDPPGSSSSIYRTFWIIPIETLLPT